MAARGHSVGLRAAARSRLRPAAPRGGGALRHRAGLRAGLADDVQLPGARVLSQARLPELRRPRGSPLGTPASLLPEATDRSRCPAALSRAGAGVVRAVASGDPGALRRGA